MFRLREISTMRHRTGHWPAYVLVAVVAGCASKQPQPLPVIEPPIVPFAQVFTLADTLRLDSAVVVGGIEYIDVNSDGDILVSDGFAPEAYVFDRRGRAKHTFRPSDCVPSWTGTSGITKWGPHGTAVYRGPVGIVVFNEMGQCAESDTEIGNVRAACTIADTIYTLPVYARLIFRKIRAYSMELDKLWAVAAVDPKFPNLNEIVRPNEGFAMACFTDGPYYVTVGSPDARAVWGQGGMQFKVHPTFFDTRPQDLPLTRDRDERLRELGSHPVTVGVIALDAETRLVVYGWLRKKWMTDPQASPPGIGLGIASNTNLFSAISTVSPVWPFGGSDGVLYSVGETEKLSDGDIGNPVIIRYKFIPPSDAAP
ncbi:MAG: hypothetical protein OXU68_07470 [Bacteroidota bacterium]|nr:hypothetical protein [Bacteroidota bacterium]